MKVDANAFRALLYLWRDFAFFLVPIGAIAMLFGAPLDIMESMMVISFAIAAGLWLFMMIFDFMGAALRFAALWLGAVLRCLWRSRRQIGGSPLPPSGPWSDRS